MEFSLFGCKIKIDYLFIILLSFAALFNSYDLLYILLYSFLHEMGHLVALLILKGKADSIALSYYGAALKYETRLSRWREAVLLLAGPLVNLILYILLKDSYNLIIFALNILPIYPLDGGRILGLFLPKLSKGIGYAFLLIIFLFSVYLAFVYKSVSLMLIVIYLFIYSINY